MSALFAPMVAILLTLGCAMACSKDTNRSESDASERSDGVPTRPELASHEAEFRWPTDPRDPVLVLEIELPDHNTGAIEIELVRTLAPRSVARIATLVDQAYYDGTTFHRVIPGFVIQGGDPRSRDQDPSNDGKGGDLTGLPDETSSAPFDRGVVALANKGRPASNSSQLFIMLADHPELDGRYTVLGRVISGIEVVDAIASTKTDRVGRWGPKDRPIESIVIRRASIRSSGTEAAAPFTTTATQALPTPQSRNGPIQAPRAPEPRSAP